jgi:CRISPR-associated protein Cas2
MVIRLDVVIHDRDDHVLIRDLGPADNVDPRVESLGKTFESVKRTAVVI